MTATDIAQRSGAARAYLQTAEESFVHATKGDSPSADAQVAAANSVLAGIAASDAICGKILGERASDQDHNAAVKLLASVIPDGPRISTKLGRLLGDKTQVQYGNYSTTSKAETMLRNARELVDSMTNVHNINSPTPSSTGPS